jgi:hypothetical protein
VFRNGISVAPIDTEGLDVDSTYQELIPNEEGKVIINLFFLFGS